MIYISGVISLIVQVLTGVIDFLALNIDVIAKDQLIKDLLQVELFVQLIELIFYIWFIYYLHGASKNITPFRYLDWAITTPTMLITLSAFLNHNGNKTNRLSEFIFNNAESMIKIVLLNGLMLTCGLLGEFGYLSHYTSTALGFIPFAINFKNIKDAFLPDYNDFFKNAVFYWFVFFWGLYGVFALTSYTIKNTGYNILDIFAKNFFGLFLAYTVWTKQK